MMRWASSRRVALSGKAAYGGRDQAGEVVLVVEGLHERPEGLVEAGDLVGRDAGPAGRRVEEPVGQEAVPPHVDVVVVEHHPGRGVEDPDLVVGHPAGGHHLRVEVLVPVRAVHGQVGVGRQGGAHGLPEHASRVADEQHRRAGVGHPAVGVEVARVGALQQGLTSSPQSRRTWVGQLTLAAYTRSKPLISSASHTRSGWLMIHCMLRASGWGATRSRPRRTSTTSSWSRDERWRASRESTDDELAAPLERGGERAREVGVAPPLAPGPRRRRRVDRPAQARRALVDAAHRSHHLLLEQHGVGLGVLRVGGDPLRAARR